MSPGARILQQVRQSDWKARPLLAHIPQENWERSDTMDSTYEELKRMFDWVQFDDGRAKFNGLVRGADEAGHNTFAVQLLNRNIYYGEFRPCFEQDKNHFNIEILGFGYVSENDVGIANPDVKSMFNHSEERALERVITSLMLRDVKKPSPFNHPEAFLGKIFFRQGWLKLRH